MPFVIKDRVEVLPSIPRKLPSSLHFQPFFAQLRCSDQIFHENLTLNPLFVEGIARIRLLHDLLMDCDGRIHQEAQLATLAECAPPDSTSKFLLDLMSLWGKKMHKVKSLCEIMDKCTREMSTKVTSSPNMAHNPRSAETPYTLEQKMASLEETMKRKLGGELLSIQVQIAEKRRRMNFSNEAVKILKQWFSSHTSKPYPTEEEKEQLAEQSGITVHQVTNWFINMRKRNWDPAF
jgi:hypothetical protein